MFTETEMEYLTKNTEQDLEALKYKIDQLVDQMALCGKQITELKITQAKVMSIQQALKDEQESAKEDDE